MEPDVERSPSKFVRLTEMATKLGVTVASLRSEAARSRLAVYRFAGKDWTTEDAIREMFEKCRVEPKEAAKPAQRTSWEDELSREERCKIALEAARANAQRLKNGLPPISPKWPRRSTK